MTRNKMTLCVVIADLMREIDACNAFIQARPVGSTEAVAQSVRVMERFLVQYKLAHNVRDIDRDGTIEPERSDNPVERRDEVV